MLIITCLTLVSSPYKVSGIDASQEYLNSKGLSPSLALESATNSLNITLKSYSLLTISILLASILLISNIPFTISNKVLEALIISFTSSTALGGNSSSFNPWLNPTMALSGVLISCDILDKNSLLAKLALSACILAWLSCSINFISGFSIVKYIKNITKNSIEVIKVTSGYAFCTKAIIPDKHINDNKGINLVALILLKFLRVVINHTTIAKVEIPKTKFTANPVACPTAVSIGKIAIIIRLSI